MTTLTVEIPQAIADGLATYLEQHRDSSSDRAVAGAVALWLLQNGQSNREISRAYLDAAFPYLRGHSGADAA